MILSKKKSSLKKIPYWEKCGDTWGAKCLRDRREMHPCGRSGASGARLHSRARPFLKSWPCRVATKAGTLGKS